MGKVVKQTVPYLVKLEEELKAQRKKEDDEREEKRKEKEKKAKDAL